MYDKELKYNFYNILAVKSGVDKGLHFVYEGQPNEPNIVLSDNNELKKYVCKNLYVFSNNNDSDGEMIIENECTCNYGKKIYLRILLNTERLMPTNEIDKLFENRHVELDLNSVLQNEDDCIYTETTDGILVTFTHPINVHSKFNKLANNPIFASKPKPLFEGFDVVAVPDENGNLIDADGQRVTFDVSGSSYMECDNLPIDSPLVPTYSANVNQQYDNRVAETLAMSSIAIFFIAVAFIWYSINLMYKGVGSLLKMAGIYEYEKIITYLNYIEIFGLFVVIITSIVIVSVSKTHDETVKNLMTSFILIILTIVFSIIAYMKKRSEDKFGIPSDVNFSEGDDAKPAKNVKKAWKNARFLLCALKMAKCDGSDDDDDNRSISSSGSSGSSSISSSGSSSGSINGSLLSASDETFSSSSRRF
jgi:uncharacterized membrane protein YgcG